MVGLCLLVLFVVGCWLTVAGCFVGFVGCCMLLLYVEGVVVGRCSLFFGMLLLLSGCRCPSLGCLLLCMCFCCVSCLLLLLFVVLLVVAFSSCVVCLCLCFGVCC